MRIIDADKVLKLINDERNSALAKHDFGSVRCYKNAFEIIDEQSIEFDIDKILDEIDDLQERRLNEDGMIGNVALADIARIKQIIKEEAGIDDF